MPLVLGPSSAGGKWCRVPDSDLRVRLLSTGPATYPDVRVVCGLRERYPEDENAVTDPMLIVEVSSRRTEEYDRGDEFEHYKRIPSLRQDVLVSHREPEVEVWTRDDADGWSSTIARGGERANLSSIGAELDVQVLYEAIAEPPA